MKSLTKTTLLMSMLCLIHNQAAAQINLVPNPSFEEYTSCPDINPPISITFLQDWYSPTLGSPDYLNSCAGWVPQNGFGYQNARTGMAYIGFGKGTNFLREYIQCQLTSPLQAGKKYRVSFYVSRADSIPYACDNIGAYLSLIPVSSSDNSRLPYTPQVTSKLNSPITNDTAWVQISDTVTAIGGEQYLTIGVFAFDSDINVTGGGIQTCYYFVDDVKIEAVADSFSLAFEMPNAFSPNGDYINDTYFPVYFTNSFVLKEFRIHNRWGQLLHNNPTKGWDGTYKSEPQPIDTYTFYVYADIPDPDNPNQKK